MSTLRKHLEDVFGSELVSYEEENPTPALIDQEAVSNEEEVPGESTFSPAATSGDNHLSTPVTPVVKFDAATSPSGQSINMVPSTPTLPHPVSFSAASSPPPDRPFRIRKHTTIAVASATPSSCAARSRQLIPIENRLSHHTYRVAHDRVRKKERGKSLKVFCKLC